MNMSKKLAFIQVGFDSIEKKMTFFKRTSSNLLKLLLMILRRRCEINNIALEIDCIIIAHASS